MKKILLRSVLVFFMLFGMTSLMADKPKVDIIFIMDTSGSLDNEAPALVTATQTVSQDLAGTYDLHTELWSITNEFDFSSSGFDSSVVDKIPNHTVNQYEDWGPATYDVASYYTGWRKDAIKIVVPISDEGPEDGDGLYQNDKDIIKQARQALEATDIYAVPIIAQGSMQDTLYKEYGIMLSDNAIKTGSGDLVEQFKTIIENIVAEASGASLGSITARFVESFGGGKLVIDAKGAGKYDVSVKFDGTEILSTTTHDNTVSVSYPIDYDMTQDHTLEIEYTAYAVDASGNVLEQKSKSLTYTVTKKLNFVEPLANSKPRSDRYSDILGRPYLKKRLFD